MKRLLLIDAVEFPPERAGHPLSNVGRWFGRHIEGLSGVDFHAVASSRPDLKDVVADADGIIFSGSPRDAWSDDPAIVRLVDFMRETVNRGQPLLGVCFGHQILARAFGGTVARNPAGWEVGERNVTITAAGRECGLFEGMPETLRVIESHQDAVLSLPPDATLLVENSHTPIQGFGIGSRAFGVQFHPEMDGILLRHLWAERRERLRPAMPFKLDTALDTAGETPDAARIFANFVSLLNL